jgi:hypothetical protein
MSNATLPEQSAFGADAALILAALDRMEAAMRSERTALGRVRVALGEMAGAVAQAKAALHAHAIGPDAAAEVAALDVAALLDELEHRLDAMIEIAGGIAPAGAPAGHGDAQPAPDDGVEPPKDDASETIIHSRNRDRVPTVSGVVSRLGRSHEGFAAPTAVTGDRDVPSVSMLEAMVEALSVSPPAAVETTAAPPAAALPGDAVMRESDLLAGLAQLEAFPFLPAEEGAAVIFSAKPEAKPEPEPAPLATPVEVAVASELQPDDAGDFLFGPAPEPAALPRGPEPPPASEPEYEWETESEFVSVPEPGPLPAAAQPTEPPAAAALPEPGEPAPQIAPQPRHDPLAPLKAMSAEETIALFS